MTKMTKKQITKTVLEAVATEFNSVILDEESGIQMGKDVAKDDLQADVIEVAGIIEATDLPNLSEKTLEVLSVLGVELPEATETEPEVEETGGIKEDQVMVLLSKTKVPDAPKKEDKKKKKQVNPETTKRNQMIESLITDGKYTAIQIKEMVFKQFPDQNISTISTILSDCKNPKYNKFSKVAIMNSESKILSFS